jgi:hypothetical protein
LSKTVLITGATGNLGAKISAHLAANGYNLRLICLNPTGRQDVVTADLTRYDDSWARVFSGVDAVVHLAGEARPTANWDTVLPLNITLLLNVFEAMRQYGGSKMIFASSNWVMAGYRFSTERLTTKLPPKPINPYGISKLFGERAGKSWVGANPESGIRSFLAFRIGYCQADDNRPGPHMSMGQWGQEMWLSNRDLTHAIELAVNSKIGFTVLNLMSANPGMRWDIEETRKTIGYMPQDSHVAEITEAMRERETVIRAKQELIALLEDLTASRDW